MRPIVRIIDVDVQRLLGSMVTNFGGEPGICLKIHDFPQQEYLEMVYENDMNMI